MEGLIHGIGATEKGIKYASNLSMVSWRPHTFIMLHQVVSGCSGFMQLTCRVCGPWP